MSAHLSSNYFVYGKVLCVRTLALSSLDCHKFEIARQRYCSEAFLLISLPVTSGAAGPLSKGSIL